MRTSVDTVRLMTVLAAHRAAVADALNTYGLINPRLFGSLARGTASAASDIDLLVDVAPNGRGSVLSRVAGCVDDLQRTLGERVNVITPSPAKTQVLDDALREAIPLREAVSRHAALPIEDLRVDE